MDKNRVEGAQFPAKSFDDEPHRLAQALRWTPTLLWQRSP